MNQKSESVCGESEVRRIVSAENGNGKTEAKIGSEANRKRAKIGAAKRKRRSEARRGERIKRESNAVLKAFNTDEKTESNRGEKDGEAVLRGFTTVLFDFSEVIIKFIAADACAFERVGEREIFFEIGDGGGAERLRNRYGRSSEFHAARFRKRDAFGLPSSDVLPFVFRDKG